MRHTYSLLPIVGLALAGCGGNSFVAADGHDSGDEAGDLAEAMPSEGISDGADSAIPSDAAEASPDARLDAQAETDTGAYYVQEAGADAPVDAASADAADAHSCPCGSDLSNVGLGDFSIAFSLTTASTSPMALLNQRATCDQAHSYWDVHTGTNGAYSASEGVIYIEVGDGTNVFDDVSTQRTVNDGQPHRIVIERTTGGTYFTLSVDGVGAPQGVAPTDPLTGTLPVLQTGTDVCMANGPVAGTISEVCIRRCL
jgi:hypothetical protein